jgi:hypothetical protein
MVAAVLDAAGEYSDAQQIRRCADCGRDRLAWLVHRCAHRRDRLRPPRLRPVLRLVTRW